MKLACTSGAFSSALERGDLTQLEFLDRAARELRCDGVVLDVRHFPRSDADYLAQVKKMSTDLGLTVAALYDDGFFAADEAQVERCLAQAGALGAPLVSGRLARDTECSWSEQLSRLSVAAGLAKRANVTLAVRNAPGTFAASAHDCRRVAKETDSAWLRFSPDFEAFDDASELASLASRTVLLWFEASVAADAVGAFYGTIALDRPGGGATFPEMREAARRWRAALTEIELNRT